MADLTFRALTNYADGTPGSTDRMLFETSANLPRGCTPATFKSTLGLAMSDISGLDTALAAKAPSASPTFTGTVTIPDAALAIADTSGLQTALDAKAPLASPTFTGTVTLSGSLDGNGNSIIDYIQPHVSGVTGTLTQAAHGGRAILATGTITVPVTNGFICLIRNKSGANRTIQPASGSLIHDGATAATIVLPTNRSVAVHGDGTDVWVDGAIA